MSFVVGVLQAGNDGSGCADQFSQLALAQAGFSSKLIDLPPNFIIGPRLFQGGNSVRLSLVVALMQDFNGSAGSFSFGRHWFSSKVCCLGFAVNLFLFSIALSVSLGGIRCSLVIPCDRTAAMLP